MESGGQIRVSAGHRFLRNPVHRSAAEMCRGGQCKNSMMSAGHRFTSLRGIIIEVYAIVDGKSMSCGHLCFFYFTFPAHLRCAPMYRVTQKSVSCGHPLIPTGTPILTPGSSAHTSGYTSADPGSSAHTSGCIYATPGIPVPASECVLARVL